MSAAADATLVLVVDDNDVSLYRKAHILRRAGGVRAIALTAYATDADRRRVAAAAT